MYVRWQRRKRTRAWYGEETTLLTATLVESRRIDGKPRQHIVAYLGSIKDTQVRYPLSRAHFWRQTSTRIDALGLHPVERATIEAALSEVVPHPDPDEVAKIEDEADRFSETLRRFAQTRRRESARLVGDPDA